MKSILLSLLILMLLMSACHKDKPENISPVSEGIIVADINGKKTTFNIDAIADTVTSFFDSYRNSFMLSVTGTEDATPKPAKIKIWFFAVPASPIGVGTYPDLNAQIYAYVDYKAIWKDTLWDYTGNGYKPYVCQAAITSMDSAVQGTFSGNVIIGVGSTGVEQPPLSYSISNGRFNVAIHH